METIGEKIRRIRKSKGISQMTVADTCGIKQSSYANIESGKTQNITIEIGRGIADALGLSFNELFEIEVPFNYASEELKRDVEKLLEMVKAGSNRISELEKRIEEKDLAMQALIANRKFFISTLVKYLEKKDTYSFYWMAIQGYKYAKTEEQKEYVELQIKQAEKQREGMYDYFLNEGIISKNEIEQSQKAIKEFYDSMDYESAFKRQFEDIANEMIQINSMLDEQKKNK